MDYFFILDWLNKIQHLPAHNISALNFGIFETETGYTMYLTGAFRYDAENDDWSVVVDYQPENTLKYKELPVEIIKNKSWQYILEYCTGMLKMVFNSKSLPSEFQDKIITTGFDDGELIRIV